ncbi:hypothetical protein DL766_006859 [Monosporascus sp. MC13-8B]|nr:hypothetical protein DL763_008157 [Monosporascus cannonballus]RYP25977.1 hypothetical protein DL766_006859 [Monosporascus sp. MC13-8B]
MPTLPIVSMRRAVHDSIQGLVTRAEFDHYDFDSEFRDTRDTVRTGQRIVSGGIIAVIVIIRVVFISSCVIGCCVYSRIRKRRHERRQIEMKINTSYNSTSYPTNQNGIAPYPTYPNFGPGANNPVADPAPAYTPGHTGGTYKGPDGEAAGGYGIGHSSGHAGGL